MKNLILTATLLVTSVLILPAQDISTLVEEGENAMRARKWAEALAFHAKAIEQHGSTPQEGRDNHGNQFALIWYRKGICELHLKKYEDAIKSFEITYKDFPNNEKDDGNKVQKMALLKWGEAAYGAKKYQEAIDQWTKFIKERGPRDSYPQGLFHVNMAICHYYVGEIPKGNEHLEIAIKNKNTFAPPTPNTAIVSGFQVLIEVSLKGESEQAFLDFVNKNRGALMMEPFEMQRFSKIFMKLAGDAVAAEKVKTALALYQFVPHSQVAIEDLAAKIKTVGKLPANFKDGSSTLNRAKMEEELSALKAEHAGNKSLEMIKLAAIAYIYEKQGYVPAAYAAYYQLETLYSRSEKREDNLFNLIRTASILSKLVEVQSYSETFIKTYPESKHKPAVMRLMLSSLFFSGEYETCIEIASDLISNEKLAVNTPEHDLALFVLGGSYFYTGQYDAAVPFLDNHIATYPESKFEMQAAYFQASNTYRLQLWAEAATRLDKFLEKYKDHADQTYTPLALLDRANTHFSQDEIEATLEKIDRLVKDFPDTESTNQALNLKGNVLEGKGEIAEAIETYQKSLEQAESRGNVEIAGEAVYYLVALLSSDKSDEDPETRFPKAVAYADKYWKEYANGSPYRAQTAVGQMPAMEALGRGEEALTRLQEIISEMAKLQEAYGLEEAINSYTEAYLKTHTPDELKEHYYNFPGVEVQDKVARALLRIAVIGVYENLLSKAKDEEEKRALNAMIQVLFQNLKTEFDVKELSNFILVKLGDFLRTKTAAPLEALPYYDEALSRQDQSYRFDALLGRADVYGKSKAKEDLTKAIEDFERVLTDSEEKKQREFALYRIIQVLMAKGDFAEASKRANEYLNRDTDGGPTHGFSNHRAEVGYILAQSFEKRNMTEDAIQMYVKVWSTSMGNIKISAPAMRSWMELSYARNNASPDPRTPSDRQGAYEGGYNYLEQTRRFKDRFTPEELELWTEVEKLTERYVADPQIKSMEQILKEREANK